MTTLPTTWIRRAGAALLACGLAALLSACFITPGKFVSTLDIRKDGHFTYTYKGEIFMLAFAALDEADKDEEFTPSTCYNDDSSEERDCSKQELAQQRKDWDDAATDRAARRKREADEMRAFLGGIDPNDPQAPEKFAEKLRRQTGWNNVVHKGAGLFDVDYSVQGKLTYDFAFPTMEQVTNSNPFLQLASRKDGTVRMDAPAFGGSASDPLRMAALGKGLGDSSSSDDLPNMPKMSGTFTLTTDATILSNNTDDGPQADPAGKKMQWAVGGAETRAAPMALIQLQR